MGARRRPGRSWQFRGRGSDRTSRCRPDRYRQARALHPPPRGRRPPTCFSLRGGHQRPGRHQRSVWRRRVRAIRTTRFALGRPAGRPDRRHRRRCDPIEDSRSVRARSEGITPVRARGIRGLSAPRSDLITSSPMRFGRSRLVSVCVLGLVLAGCQSTPPAPTTSPAPATGTEILWDRYGVPHIFAPDHPSLFHAYGYAQMEAPAELLVRLYAQARGRGAECLGAGAQGRAQRRGAGRAAAHGRRRSSNSGRASCRATGLT